MYAHERLHLDHDEHGGYLPGLACEPCNIKAAAAKAHARRYRRPAARVTTDPGVRCVPCPHITRNGSTVCRFGYPERAGRLPSW